LNVYNSHGWNAAGLHLTRMNRYIGNIRSEAEDGAPSLLAKISREAMQWNRKQ